MFVLAIKGKEHEGAYAVTDPEGEKALYLFEEEDDALRYGGLLEVSKITPTNEYHGSS